MIINFYTATANGDIIVFEQKLTLAQNQALTFVDTTTGENISFFFVRNFRYALDGVHFTQWMALNQTNLNALSALLIEPIQKIWFHFQYVYSGGTAGAPALTINTATINGQNVLKTWNYQLTTKTIFGRWVNDSLVYDLTINLAAKLFDSGIVPEYIERKRDDAFALNTDQDYIDFWTTVAHYYSIFYVYMLQFTSIFYNAMLCEYLKQQGVFFCSCSDTATLQAIAKNFYSEITTRGSVDLFRPKGYVYPIGERFGYTVPAGYTINNITGVMINGVIYYIGQVVIPGDFSDDFSLDFNIGINAAAPPSALPYGWYYNSTTNTLYSPGKNFYQIFYYNSATGNYDLAPASKSLAAPTTNSGVTKPYDGEFLRMICKGPCDEFIFLNIPIQFSGWNLDNSSPIYRGLRPIYSASIIKGYENTYDFLDLTRYEPIGTGGTLVTQSISYLNQSFPTASTLRLTTGQGFGFSNVPNDNNFAINVSRDIDYEISFWFKQTSTAASFTLQGLVTDCNQVSSLSLTDINTGNTNSYFISGTTRVAAAANTWYFARFILYNSSQVVVKGRQPMTSLAAGTNLIMPTGAQKFKLALVCTANQVDIWNFKIKPAKTQNDMCFIDRGNLMVAIMKNNNKNLNLKQIKKNVSRYLMPYNTTEIIINSLFG